MNYIFLGLFLSEADFIPGVLMGPGRGWFGKEGLCRLRRHNRGLFECQYSLVLCKPQSGRAGDRYRQSTSNMYLKPRPLKTKLGLWERNVVLHFWRRLDRSTALYSTSAKLKAVNYWLL
jgi:hypothetical protein